MNPVALVCTAVFYVWLGARGLATRTRHQLDHLLLGALVFLAGAIFQRTHTHHHGGKK